MSEFCIDCGQKIPVKKTLFSSKLEGHEFKDGWRCNGCGRAYVEKIRKAQQPNK